MSARYDHLEEIDKFNPYHDALGRFSSANGATSMTIRTHSTAGQKAINKLNDSPKMPYCIAKYHPGPKECDDQNSNTENDMDGMFRFQKIMK